MADKGGHRRVLSGVDGVRAATPDWSEYSLEDHVVLFREGRSDIHILDSVGHWIWSCLRSGLPVAEIIEMMVRGTEIDSGAAAAIVARACDVFGNAAAEGLSSGAGAGESATELTRHLNQRCGRRRFRVRLDFDGAAVQLATDSVRVADLILHQFGHLALILTDSDCGDWILVDADSDGFRVRSAAGRIGLGDADGLREYLLHEVVEAATRQLTTLLVLHAGSVVRDGVGVVLMAASGSGKTTLTGALARAGFTYLSDDVVPVDQADHAIVPIPVPLCVKAGSWPILDPGNRSPVCRRLGQATKYILPDAFARERVGDYVIVCPRYNRGGTDTVVRPLTCIELLRHLVESESLRSPRLNGHRVGRVIDWLKTVTAWSMEYGDTGSAIKAVKDVCEQYRRVR